jgi:uncharacterized protein (UPF0303 family)
VAATTGGYTSAQLQVEADSLELTGFSLADALRLGRIATDLAVVRRLPVLIEIVVGQRVAYRVAMPGTTADNDEWLRRKFRVVARFEESTLAVRVAHEEKDRLFNETTGLPESEFAAHGGGWPIRVVGVGVVGMFGVSGLPQVADHELIVESLGIHLRETGRG